MDEPSLGLSPLLVNEVAKIIIGINKPVSFLLMGSGALGCGAAIAANANGAKVLMVDKGKLESSGCLGGGNDHFMAVLDSGPETDTAKAIGDFYESPLFPLSPKMIEEGWAKMIPTVLEILQEIGMEFVTNEDGSWMSAGIAVTAG